METPGKAKQRHIEGKTAEETEAVHVPADESEQIDHIQNFLVKLSGVMRETQPLKQTAIPNLLSHFLQA